MELNQNQISAQAQIDQIIQQAQKAAAQIAANQPIPQLGSLNTQSAPAVSPVTQPVQAGSPRSFDAGEIQELNAIRQAYEEITLSFGQLEMQKREVTKNEKKIEEKLVSVEAQEKVFLDKIMMKYGEGTFDIATGVFTPKS